MSEKTPPLDDARVARIKRAVICGGGEFVGIQTAIDAVPSVLFNSPSTGSTLSVFLSTEFAHELWGLNESKLSEAVQQRIKDSDAAFADRPVPVKSSTLKSISDMLLDAHHKIEELYAKRGKK